MNLLTTHHRTRGNGPRTRHAADAGRGMGERAAADAVRTGARAVAVAVAVGGPGNIEASAIPQGGGIPLWAGLACRGEVSKMRGNF